MKGMFSGTKGASARTHNGRAALEKAPAQLLRDTIAHVVDSGAAIMFSVTRDGGTIVVTLLDGDTRAKAYCETVDDLRQCLTDAAASFAAD